MTTINNLDLKTSVAKAVTDIFNTMLSMEVEFINVVSKSSIDKIRIVGAVSFAGKEVMGTVSIQLSDSFARFITASMLGLGLEEIEGEEEVNDVIGEVSNMVGGNLKSGFCDIGLICELSIPSITTGSDFKIESLNWGRHERFAFRHQQHTAFVEVCVKSGN